MKSEHKLKIPTKNEGILLFALSVIIYFSFLAVKGSTEFILLFLSSFMVLNAIIIIAVNNNKSARKTNIDVIFGGLGYMGLALLFAVNMSALLGGTNSISFFGIQTTTEMIKQVIASGLILVSTGFFALTD